MDISIKQVIGVVIGIIVCFLGINALEHNLQTQGSNATKITTVTHTDYSDDFHQIGLAADDEKKPKINKTIYHFKKGDYVSFDYKSIEAFDCKGLVIQKNHITCDGTINGSQEGVYILRYSISDGKNYLNCKVAIIIEGNDYNEKIYDYIGGQSS